jgi:hypothetical protein
VKSHARVGGRWRGGGLQGLELLSWQRGGAGRQSGSRRGHDRYQEGGSCHPGSGRADLGRRQRFEYLKHTG